MLYLKYVIFQVSDSDLMRGSCDAQLHPIEGAPRGARTSTAPWRLPHLPGNVNSLCGLAVLSIRRATILKFPSTSRRPSNATDSAKAITPPGRPSNVERERAANRPRGDAVLPVSLPPEE